MIVPRRSVKRADRPTFSEHNCDDELNSELSNFDTELESDRQSERYEELFIYGVVVRPL